MWARWIRFSWVAPPPPRSICADRHDTQIATPSAPDPDRVESAPPRTANDVSRNGETNDDRSPVEVRRGDPERVKACTDGVFAIMIITTILVREISAPPDLATQSLREALRGTGPELLA